MEQVNSRKLEFSWHVPYKVVMGDVYATLMNGLKDKKLLGNVCTKCEGVHFPPKPFCEMCFEECSDSVELDGEVTLITYAICWVPLPLLPNPPSITGIFKMGDCITNFVHNISGIEAASPAELESQIQIGMKMKPVWKEDADRRGHMFDIAHFKPV
jgi:uncharacterized OB-fold protein